MHQGVIRPLKCVSYTLGLESAMLILDSTVLWYCQILYRYRQCHSCNESGFIALLRCLTFSGYSQFTIRGLHSPLDISRGLHDMNRFGWCRMGILVLHIFTFP